jgi:hypothetical protein
VLAKTPAGSDSPDCGLTPVRKMQTAGMLNHELATCEAHLPDHFQAKLNLARACSGGGEHARVLQGVSVRVKDRVIVAIGQEIRRRKVCVVQDIEELGTELNIESFRNSCHAKILEDGEVDRGQSGTVQAIATGIAEQIRASACDRRQRSAKRSALGGDIGSRLWQRKAIEVEIIHATVNRIASLGDVREVHGEISIEPCAQRIAARADSGSKGGPSGHGNNGSQFPTSQYIRQGSLFGTRHVPDQVGAHHMANVEVARAVAVGL